MTPYVPPEWSTRGRNVHGIYLEVIKNGRILEKVPLPRSKGSSFILIGRRENVCDLLLVHSSISRLHAVLQFNEQGILYLYDLHSTHGSYVNKKQVVSKEFIRVQIGDILAFGDSTRLYAVCGPQELLPVEYESVKLASFREKVIKEREEEHGASWGFRQDAEEEDDDDAADGGGGGGRRDSDEEGDGGKEELPDYLRNLKDEDQPYKSSVSQLQINEKDQRLYQQLQSRIRKMENIKLETSRILAKQNQLDGLSEGQQNTLERNEQRIATLMKEIDDLEARIHAKNDQRTKTRGVSGTATRRKRNRNDELYGYSSDEDDFYDRTKANQQKLAMRKQKITSSTDDSSGNAAKKTARVPKSEILTADSIQANVNKLEAELAKLQDQLTAASTMASDNQTIREDSKQEEQADSLDSFMAVATTQLHVNEVDTLTKRKDEVEMELMRQRQLLAVATPALAAIPIQKPLVKTVTNPVGCSSSDLSSEVHVEPSHPVSAVEKRTTEPVATAARNDDSAPDNKCETSETKTASIGKPKTRSAASHESRKTAGKTEPSVPKRRRIVGPAVGPPPQMKPSGSDEKHTDDSKTLEGGDQVWVPPTNQTGDGRTKLNDKYGY
ncbi:unnamed protein product [Peronospora belbahrii]|uniref:FHA domain-containing protein n=1 Tax=Peronospora belbahrii TaxID=622444 RepID=A0AAU9L5B6_9STRA|nr:unnamed protein product [Peronospora belbahrii]CAH0521134.1 unnamed protein product [Peronospora belbahrii]